MDWEKIAKILAKHGYQFLAPHETDFRRLDIIYHFQAKDKTGTNVFGSVQKNPAKQLNHRFLWQKYFYHHQDKLQKFSVPEPIKFISDQEYSFFLQEYLSFEEPQDLPIGQRIDICLGALRQIHAVPLPKEKLPLINYHFPYRSAERYKIPSRFIKTVNEFQKDLARKVPVSRGENKCLHGDITPGLENTPTVNDQRYCLDYSKASIADPDIDFARLLMYSQLELSRTKASPNLRKTVEEKILSEAKNSRNVLAWAISFHAAKLLTVQRYQFNADWPDPDHRQKRCAIHIQLIQKNAATAKVNIDTYELEKTFLR